MGLNLLERIYQALNQLGAVKTRQEFCLYWLGRGEGYMRTLRFTSLEPSVDVISVLRSRIRYYASHYVTETESTECDTQCGGRGRQRHAVCHACTAQLYKQLNHPNSKKND
jgi:DNA helicase HerA-like ATPase